MRIPTSNVRQLIAVLTKAGLATVTTIVVTQVMKIQPFVVHLIVSTGASDPDFSNPAGSGPGPHPN